MKWFGTTSKLIPETGNPVRRSAVRERVERVTDSFVALLRFSSPEYAVEIAKSEWVEFPDEEGRDCLEDMLLAYNLVDELEGSDIYIEIVLSTEEKKQYLLKEFGRVCQSCFHRFRSAKSLEVDHIIPISDGGPDYLCNATLLCKPCNLRKSNRFTLSGLRAENNKLGLLED